MAEQVRIQSTKEEFQTAFDSVVKIKESAEARFKDDHDAGLIDQTEKFDHWWPVNAPDYAQAKANYEARRAQYQMALQHGDQKGFQDWQEKAKQAALDNPGEDGRPNYDVLVGPN